MDFIYHLNFFDWILISVVFLSFLFGVMRGLLRELISLATWTLAFFVAIMFADKLSGFFLNYVKTPIIAHLTSFIILFVLVLIIGAIVNNLIASLVNRNGLTFVDRILGAFFGIVRGLAIIVLVIFILVNTGFKNAQWFEESQLTKQTHFATSWMQVHAIDSENKKFFVGL